MVQGLSGSPDEAARVCGFLIHDAFRFFAGVGNTGGALVGKVPSCSSSSPRRWTGSGPGALTLLSLVSCPRCGLRVLGWVPD